MEKPPVEVNLFGGFQLRVDGDAKPRPGRQVSRLFALAAVSSQIAVEEAIEQLWPTDLPADPRGALRVVLSRARGALGEHRDALVNQDSTLRFQGTCDVARFRRLVGEANDNGGQLDTLEQAFDLHGGRRVDTCDELALLEEVRELVEIDRRRLAVDGAPQLVANGHARTAIGVLEPIWNHTHHDETLGYLLAQALASNGERSRALDVLHLTRVALRDEHGIGLTSRSEDLLVELLRQPGGLAPAHAPVALRAEAIPTVGIERIVAGIPTDGDRVAVIEGFAGDGKSTVAAELEHRWASDGRRVIHVRASSTPAQPMQVVADVLTELCDADIIDPEDLDAQTIAAAHRVRPGLFGDVGPSGIGRDAVVSLVASLIAEALERSDGVLMVDDLQFCDWATIEVLDSVIASTLVPVLLTSRVTRPGHVSDLIGRLASNGRGEVIRLPGLVRDDIAELVQRCVPNRRIDVDELFRRSAGHPLFVSLLMGLLIDGDDDDELPSTVMLAVERRTASIGQGARSALSLLSMFPDGAELDLLTMIRPAIRPELDELERADLLAPGSPIRVRHSVIAAAVQQITPKGARLAWHDQISYLLQQRGATAGTWAYHALEAADFDPERAFGAAIAAASEATEIFAWNEVIELTDRADAIWTKHALTDRYGRSRSVLLGGRARLALGVPGSEAPLLEAVEIAREADDDITLAESIIELCSYGRTSPIDSIGTSLFHEAEQLIRRDPPAELRYELAAALGTMTQTTALTSRAREWFLFGWDGARQRGDIDGHGTVERRVLVHAPRTLVHFDDLDLRKRAAQRMRELSPRDPDGLWIATYIDFSIALINADRPGLDRALADLRELKPQLRMRDRSFALQYLEASYARATGDIDAAEQLALASYEIGRRRFPEHWVKLVMATILGAVYKERGEISRLLPTADEGIARDPDNEAYHFMAAAGAAELGDVERTRTELDFFHRNGFDFRRTAHWSAAFSALSGAVALLDDRVAAEALALQIRPYSGLMVWTGVTVHRPVDHYLAIFDRVLGKPTADAYQQRADATVARLTA